MRNYRHRTQTVRFRPIRGAYLPVPERVWLRLVPPLPRPRRWPHPSFWLALFAVALLVAAALVTPLHGWITAR